jgi:hypothetical protein
MSEPRYDSDPEYARLAESVVGTRIERATVMEDMGSAWVRLSLRTPDGTCTCIDIGVTGSLHDEAYLLFAPVPEAIP